VIVSLILVNSVFATDFQTFLDRKIGFENDTIHLNFSVESWINDGLVTTVHG
jgi:Na+:H+ antiporter, NhaA family